jgi:hypothetical protein
VIGRPRFSLFRGPLLPAVRAGWAEKGQDQIRTPTILQLLSERRLGRLTSRQDRIDLVSSGSCEESKVAKESNDEPGKIEQESSQFQQFAIESASVRFVAEEGGYAISGSVTGPCAAQTRIRVWRGDPVTGYKLRDLTLGTEALISGGFVVDLPSGNNIFSLTLEEFQLPANIPLPPDCANPWVLTASAVDGEAESDPVLLPPPEHAYRAVVSSTEISLVSTDFESDRSEPLERLIISDPPPGGVTVLNDTTYEIRGVQAGSSSLLLIEAWPMAYGERVASARPFATVLDPGETEFSVLVRLLSEGANSFVVRATDLNSGMESALVSVPSITRRQTSRPGTHYHPKRRNG